MKLRLITMNGQLVDDDVYEVILPTVDGEIAVFPDHEPLVTVAKSGVVTVRYDKGHGLEHLEYFAISGGIVEVTGDSVRVLVDEAEHGDDIVEAETQAALERAIKMRHEAKDQVELEKAHQLVDRHMVRLKVADLHRRRRKL